MYGLVPLNFTLLLELRVNTFSQFVSSRGISHFHDTHCPGRIVLADEDFLLKQKAITRKSHLPS
jgi:hypothetical protein